MAEKVRVYRLFHAGLRPIALHDLEILATVNRHTAWMEEFQHWQQRHHHGRPEDRVIYAGVIGIGCTIGIRKMARISHPLSEAELENTVNWYFSVDNLNAANDRVLQF